MKILKKGGGVVEKRGGGGNEIHVPCACDSGNIAALSLLVLGTECAGEFQVVCCRIHQELNKRLEPTYTYAFHIYDTNKFTAYPSGAPEFTPGFSGVHVARSLVF